MGADRVQAVETALRNVQAQAAALEELSEQLSLSVHMLETEIAALTEEARLAREQAESSQPSPGDLESAAANGMASKPQRSTDADGARLVALNMALAGEPREAAERYLDEHYEVPDRERLLDDVYAAVEA